MKVINKDNINIDELVSAINAGTILVVPTDTVYGFVCDAGNQQAVEKIFEIKKRNKSETLPIFVKNMEMAKNYAEISQKQETEIKKSWPGAVTYVLNLKNIEPRALSNLVTKKGTIAMRMPKYDLVLKILEKFKKPLAQTSANISGTGATTEIENILKQFAGQDIIVVDAGNLPKNKPSSIIDLTKEDIKIIRN